MRLLRAILLGMAVALLAGVLVYAAPTVRERVALLRGETIYPTITPDATASGTVGETREFAFEGGRWEVDAPADAAVYRGALTSRKSAVRLAKFVDDGWVDGYYRAFVDERHQDDFYATLLQALRSVRDRRHLDSDRYLELAASLVQSLPYKVDSFDSAPKFPIQTWVDGTGDCDDKSLLLAGLLSREGYDVALLYFGPEKHVAVGVRVAEDGYRKTGYAYLEATEPSLVGFVPEKLAGGGKLESKPRVVRIGSGTKRFGAYRDVLAIRRTLETARTRRTDLKRRIDDSRKRISDAETNLKSLQQRANSLAAGGDRTTWQQAVDEYQSAYAAYSQLIDSDRTLVTSFNQTVDVEKRIADDATDRPGLYAYVRSLGW